MKQIKRAVCVIIPLLEDRVLAVTRRDSELVGFPGGKVDPGETDVEAAVRETFEETSVQLDITKMYPIYGAIIFGPDGEDYFTTCFIYAGERESHELNMYEEGIMPMAASLADMVTKSAFNDYNKAALIHCAAAVPKIV